MNEYTLNDLQKCELEILKEYIRVCQIIGVQYYLDAGTLLGAVRHGGFIPWDDDIDVFMERKDYEIFKLEAPKHLKKQYFLQTHESDIEYLFSYAKIRNSETTYIESSSQNLDINHGVYIDIFIYDEYDVTKPLKNRIINKLLALYNTKIYSGFKQLNKQSKVKKLIANLCFLGQETNKIVTKKDKIIKTYSKGNYEHLRQFSSIYSVKKSILKKEWLGKPKLMKFEDIEAYVPENYDMWLKTIYGDYMTPPPLEKRISHHETIVEDLNTPYKEYLNQNKKEQKNL